jgi:hypothetical protein
MEKCKEVYSQTAALIGRKNPNCTQIKKIGLGCCVAISKYSLLTG